MIRTLLSLSLLLSPAAALAAKTVTKTAPLVTPRPSYLGDLNGLTKILAPRGTIEVKELERLLENAEAVALRDASGRPSAQAITYAAALDRQIDTMKGERPVRTLVDLGIVLATLANPNDDFRQKSYADAFYKKLLLDLSVKESEARPRQEIVAELGQVGTWAQGLVEYFAPKLPVRLTRVSLGRLYLATGKHAAAIEYLAPLAGTDPRLRALLGAARLFEGKAQKAEVDLALAMGAGGEAAQIARAAIREAARRRTTADLRRAFGDRDLGEDGGIAMCRQATGGSVEQASACAARLWMSGDQKAALAQAERAPGAPHWRMLQTLFKLSNEHDGSTIQKLRKLLDDQVVPLPLGDRNRALVRIGAGLQAALAAGAEAPFGAEELALLDKLSKEAPCDPQSLPLRLLALRGDRAATGQYASTIVAACAGRPDGLGATLEALTALLELFHSTSPYRAVGGETESLETTEKFILAFAERLPEEASVVALKADLLVLRGLRKEKAKQSAFRAALLVYEDALGKLTPLASPAVRSRLESNAAFVATALIEGAPKPARVDLERRAQKHLRLGLALGERPLLAAVRAKFGILAKLSSNANPERWPRGSERRRATCLLAEQAKLAGDEPNATRYRKQLTDDAEPTTGLTLPELFVESGGAVQLLVEERAVHPLVEARSGLWFAPRCE